MNVCRVVPDSAFTPLSQKKETELGSRNSLYIYWGSLNTSASTSALGG